VLGARAGWRGRDEMLERDIAVKEILFPHGMDPAQRQLLTQRAMLKARSSGPAQPSRNRHRARCDRT
jgi:hypothetical protein